MKPKKENEIDWKEVEKSLGLKGETFARLAGISKSMWLQVKAGNRRMSMNSQFRLMLSLAIHFNFKDSGETMRLVVGMVSEYESKLKSDYPLAYQGSEMKDIENE